MHGQKGEDRKSEMVVMLWEKLGDGEKKALMLRKPEGKIKKMKKESTIKLLQHKVETLKTVKSWIEKI